MSDMSHHVCSFHSIIITMNMSIVDIFIIIIMIIVITSCKCSCFYVMEAVWPLALLSNEQSS